MAASQLIGKEGPIVRYGVHGREQPRNAFALRHVSTRARGLGHIDHAGAFVHGQQQNAYARKAFVNFSRGAETV